VSDSLIVGGTGPFTPSALLELRTTAGAFLIPRLTTAQVQALTGANGMVVYNVTAAQFQVFQAGAWAGVNTGIPARQSITVTSSVSWSPPNSIWTSLNWDTLISDMTFMYGGTGFTRAILCRVAGNYLVRLRMRIPPVASNGNLVGINKNDNTGAFLWSQALPVSGSNVEVDIQFITTLAVNDWLSVWINNQTGAWTIPVGGATFPQFGMSLIGVTGFADVFGFSDDGPPPLASGRDALK
jgi:hypothetical protein